MARSSEPRSEPSSETSGRGGGGAPLLCVCVRVSVRAAPRVLAHVQVVPRLRRQQILDALVVDLDIPGRWSVQRWEAATHSSFSCGWGGGACLPNFSSARGGAGSRARRRLDLLARDSRLAYNFRLAQQSTPDWLSSIDWLP